MNIKSKILSLFKESEELSVKEITDHLQVSKQMVHRVINQLVSENIVVKLGRPPKTIYRIIHNKSNRPDEKISLDIEKSMIEFLKENFLAVTETGNLKEDIEAFDYWCRQRKLPTKKTLSEFIETKRKYEKYYDTNGNINGIEKLKNTKAYEKIWLDELFYLDFYAIERFGKTRLGTLLHFAKQGQNKFLMKKMMGTVAGRIKKLIKQFSADAIGFIPPTIKREVQLIKFIQNNLQIELPVIEIKKISGIIPVPQKSLSKIEERIKNAENTFAVTDRRKFKQVILIDDALGSGATLNQISKKIKNKHIAEKIIGLAIVGSFKGFDIITDI